MRNRYKALALSVFVLPDGTMYSQNRSGVQKSGSYNTGAGNSRMRVVAAKLIGAPWAIAMGDDCLEGEVPQAIEKYAELGHVCKSYEVVDPKQGFEFCSHRFCGAAWPVDPSKMVFSCLDKSGNEMERIVALESELHNHPQCREIMAIVRQLLFPPRIKIGRYMHGISRSESKTERSDGRNGSLRSKDGSGLCETKSKESCQPSSKSSVSSYENGEEATDVWEEIPVVQSPRIHGSSPSGDSPSAEIPRTKNKVRDEPLKLGIHYHDSGLSNPKRV
nr:RNA-dependent RNA polymerase [Flumine sobemo-like virus 21]